LHAAWGWLWAAEDQRGCPLRGTHVMRRTQGHCEYHEERHPPSPGLSVGGS
jgi:hypothetical protein